MKSSNFLCDHATGNEFTAEDKVCRDSRSSDLKSNSLIILLNIVSKSFDKETLTGTHDYLLWWLAILGHTVRETWFHTQANPSYAKSELLVCIKA